MTSVSIETALEQLRHELGGTTFAAAPDGVALGIARPRAVEDVQTCLRWASRHAVPVVIVGTGSRLDPDVVVAGALVISTERLTGVVAGPGGTLTVRAGTRTEDVLAAVAAAGGWLPLTAGPSGTIGGDVASAAPAGPPLLELREHIVELQVVLADGQLLRAAGTDTGGPMALVNLFCGSRGLLGVITEVTLRPTERPDLAAALVGFADPCVAGDAALEICAAVPGAAVQLFGHLSLAGPTSFLPGDGAVLVVGCAPDDRGAVEEIGMAFGAEQITVCPPGPDALVLLSHAAPARSALHAAGESLREPLAVPATRLAEFCAGVHALEHRSGRTVVLVADAASGAVQPFVLRGGGARAAAEALAQVADLAAALIRDATGADDPFVATGWTARALGARSDTERGMKTALDPQGLLNPGLAY